MTPHVHCSACGLPFTPNKDRIKLTTGGKFVHVQCPTRLSLTHGTKEPRGKLKLEVRGAIRR